MRVKDIVQIRNHPSSVLNGRKGVLINVQKIWEDKSGLEDLTHTVRLYNSTTSPYIDGDNCVLCKAGEVIAIGGRSVF